MTHEHEPDLTVAEVGELIRLSPERVRKLARMGLFPNAYKGGEGKPKSPTLIPYEDVVRYRKLQPRVSA